ncbi:ATP-binding cassette domain-containing protein [Streptomyces tuirus]|uniref:ATP-binding cassette domain-containing protein n=1 Tax=Streptomyces tuirus TaxID=68278 RepID=A0A941F9L8_9ACTN|nr:ATP-binding cassette domain-containing protein [Streptomyces tuirus]
MVGVIGPNGAGKSTLVKAVFGLLRVRGGTVRLRGEDVTGRPAHELVRRGVGYVPQLQNVFPTLTVAENLRMGSICGPRTTRGGSRWSRSSSPCWPSAANRRPARCPAANARCSRWPAR